MYLESINHIQKISVICKKIITMTNCSQIRKEGRNRYFILLNSIINSNSIMIIDQQFLDLPGMYVTATSTMRSNKDTSTAGISGSG